MLDYSSRGFTLSVGQFDATDFVASFSLSMEKMDPGQLATYKGQFTLSNFYNSGTPDSELDPFSTPQRWRQGQSQVIITISGYTLPVFRIASYTYNPKTHTGTGELYQILDLLSGDNPAVPVPVQVGVEGTDLGRVCDLLLTSAYARSTLTQTVPKVTLPGFLDVPVSSRDPVGDASKLAATNYSHFWVDSTETPMLVSGDPDKATLVFRRSLSEVEYNPDLGSQFASQKFIVTGTCQRAVRPVNSSKILFANPVQSHDLDGRPVKLIVPTYKKKYQLFPDLFLDDKGRPTDTSDVLAERKTVEYRYWGISTLFEASPEITVNGVKEYFPELHKLGYNPGELVETVTIIQKTRGEVYPDKHEGDTGLVEAEKIVERDYFKVIFKTRGEVLPEAFPGDTTLVLVDAQAVAGGRVDPDGTVPNQRGRDGKPLELERPSRRETSYTKPEIPMETVTFRGEFNVSFGWTPIVPRIEVRDVGFLPDQRSADYLAKQMALREIYRRDAVDIIMPIPVEWLASGCVPFGLCDIHDARFQIENPVILFEDGKSYFSFTGIRVAGIPVIPDPVAPTPYMPVPGLNATYSVGISGIVGTPIQPVQVTAIGGTPPYTFAILSPPPGLTISSSGLISGTFTSPSTTNLVVIVSSVGFPDFSLTIPVEVSDKPTLEQPFDIVHDLNSIFIISVDVSNWIPNGISTGIFFSDFDIQQLNESDLLVLAVGSNALLGINGNSVLRII